MKFAGIILASQSPRRQKLLSDMGLVFEIVPSGVVEDPPLDELPGPYSARMAIQKALAVGNTHPEHLVIGSDTVVALGDRIMGKPESEDDARSMLSSLSGHWHEVWTAICLHQRLMEIQAVKAVKSEVRFRDLSEAEIHSYIETGEPMDKAGSYAIQGKGAAMVKEIRGSYHNVIGLPTHELGRMLEALGVDF